MVKEEEPEHCSYDDAQDPDTQKEPLLILQVRPYYPPACLKLLPIAVNKSLPPQVILLNQVPQNVHACHGTVLAQRSVQKEKGQKVFVVVQADALVDPNAVMVEFFDAETAQCTVFRARRFDYITRGTLLFVIEDDPVRFKSLQGLLLVLF